MGDGRDATLLRGVFEAGPDAIVVVDSHGRILLANSRCRTTFGYSPEELVGEQVDLLVAEGLPRGEDGRHPWFAQPLHPRPSGLLRLAAVRRDGTEFPAEVSLATLDLPGEVVVSATVRDIGGRIRDEERFRALLEAAPDATVIVDSSGTIVLANDRVGQVFGYDRAELIGEAFDVLSPDDLRERHHAGFEAYLRAPNAVPMGLNRMLRVRHRDGHDVPVEISLAPLETEDGVLVSVALRDISERLRLQADAQRLREDLIATVSHELRTPLTSIIGYTELLGDLAEPDVSERARELVGVIERNAARELRLVDDLLTMAFLDDQRLRVTLAPVDLAAIARRVVDDHQSRALDSGIVLRLVAERVPEVAGDLYRLVQVLENLVSNALKFTKPGGSVTVGLHDGGHVAVLEVRDTGVGISEEALPRIFDRLYRSPEAIAAHVQGAGLGLSIVLKIIESHRGRIEVESKPGVGTTFRVTLPYVEAPASW